jgi:hypothetical protein
MVNVLTTAATQQKTPVVSFRVSKGKYNSDKEILFLESSKNKNLNSQ